MEHKGKKWERIDEEDPGSESGQKKPRGVHGHLTKPKLFTRIKGLWRRPHGKTGPETDILLQETKIDLQKLIMEGRFLEACQSIASSGHMEGEDCGPQFQAVAERMWQVVKQALEHHGPHRELEPQLESVVAAVAWAQSNPQTPETSDLQASGVATWGSQLEKLLRRDAEARIPTPGPHDQLSPYLGKLEKAVEQSLGSGRVEQLGPSLWVRYRACFQDVLVSNLSELIRFCSNEWTGASELYKWSKKILFEKWGREKLQNVPPTSRASQAGSLLDLLVFVTWMSQLQEKLVELIQNKVENAFEKVLSCDTRQWAKSPCPTFLEIFELLEAPMRECQDLEQPITSRVQDKVMEIFSKFLQRYPKEAERFLSMHWGPGTFPELHVLENCCVLRKTWCELTQVHGPQDDLERAAQGAIDGVEQVGQDHLLQGVRAQCQSLLQDHFGRKDNKLVSALRSLCQGLEGRPNMHPSPTYKSLVWSLHKAVIGEYVQALAVHLRELAPKESGVLRNQVDTDILMLNKVFRRLECPESLAESRPLTMAHQSPDLDEMQGLIMGVLQPGECLSPDRVDRWLTDFNQKFPGYLRQDPKVKEGARSCWSCLCCCC